MTLRIIAAGKLKEAWLKAAVAEYSKRLGAYVKLEIIEVPDASDRGSAAKEKAAESRRLWSKVKKGYVIALDIAGKSMDSESFAKELQKCFRLGGSTVNILIAGSLGFDPEWLKKADLRLSLGKMTFPHQIARVLILEQVYRAFKIQRGERYHK